VQHSFRHSTSLLQLEGVQVLIYRRKHSVPFSASEQGYSLQLFDSQGVQLQPGWGVGVGGIGVEVGTEGVEVGLAQSAGVQPQVENVSHVVKSLQGLLHTSSVHVPGHSRIVAKALFAQPIGVSLQLPLQVMTVGQQPAKTGERVTL